MRIFFETVKFIIHMLNYAVHENVMKIFALDNVFGGKVVLMIHSKFLEHIGMRVMISIENKLVIMYKP